jgi:hypothetical protein
MKKSPFNLEDNDTYWKWRDRKLQNCARDINDLVVEIDDPRQLTVSEHDAIMDRCKKYNMSVYVSKLGDEEGTDIPRGIGTALGLEHLDHNRGAESDAVTALTVQDDAYHSTYIPYSNKVIHWHTDGYYNRLDLQNHALLLHCVRPAMSGGENAVIDNELVYILMREENPEFVFALMAEDAVLYPANIVDGVELRPDRLGPVWMESADGHLHMRYTMRKHNVKWKDDTTIMAAVSWMEKLLNGDSEHIFRATLQSGWGLVSNNVLHDRSAFEDDKDPANKRLLYRARYYDRIQGMPPF